MSRKLQATLYLQRFIEPYPGIKLEYELPVDLTGTLVSAEPDVGIMSDGAEDICASYTDSIGTEHVIELTDEEENEACLALGEVADDYDGYED